MSDAQFWLGVPLAYLLPGTSVNIAVYYGSLIDGLRGAILGWVCIYLPAFLSVYGLLPDWYLYRDRPGVQRLLIGVNCVSAGLALASVNNCINLDCNSIRTQYASGCRNHNRNFRNHPVFPSGCWLLGTRNDPSFGIPRKYQAMGTTLLPVHDLPTIILIYNPINVYICLRDRSE